MQTSDEKASRPGRQRALSSLPPRQTAMTPASRYEQNLKVLRRRDPSIRSIFDQFSHVCVYNHQNEKWSKDGFEGSMFLYERDVYPPYGLYILNRMGANDYSLLLYPDDDYDFQAPYFMIRFYPELTQTRLAAIDHDPKDKFSEAFLPEEILPKEEKQRRSSHKLIGLWTWSQETTGREPLSHVMNRLYEYVKKNEPYPEEYQYTNGRLPPSNVTSYTPQPRPASSADQRSASPASHNGFTPELSRLLLKLAPTSSPSLAVSATPASMPSTSTTQSSTPRKNQRPGITPSASRTGVPLLDSIFASAADTSAETAREEIDMLNKTPMIYSPTPTSSVLPQILNQDVIMNLMGLSSRASSVAPSTGSSSARDGDNEEDSEGQDVYNSVVPFSVESNHRPDSSAPSSTLPHPASSMLQLFGSVPLLPAATTITAARATHTTSRGAPALRGDETPKTRAIDTVFTSQNNKRNPITKPFLAHSEISAFHTPLTEDDDDIVELDFSETSLLSDLDSAVLSRSHHPKRRQSQSSASEETHWSHPSQQSYSNSGGQTNGKVPRDALEQVPPSGKRNRRREKRNNSIAAAMVNPEAPANAPVLDQDVVKTVVVNATRSRSHPTKRLERNEFVRELLTLIHTDSTFVDNLWQNYLDSLQ